MSSTLYRKYRPKNFSEVIGQQHIVQTLSNAIKNNRIGQAYLFTGPRGTGKTSIARILAKAVNCEKSANAISCEKCRACELINDSRSLDIIEIDAASNTGVDNIRELRETVNLPPTALKYKVYIIDEVHMLSTGAFNALLKTLEEPPAHVIFILATTEIHKVPATIISRCQRFDFTRLPIQSIIEKLSLVAKNEKVKIDKDSLEMIAIAAEGGMRDAESLLGQIIALEDKNITIKEVEEILGAADRKFATEISARLIENDSGGAIKQINSLLNGGYDLAVFNKSLINYLRQLMLLKIDPELKSSFSYELTNEQLKKMLAQSEKIELQKIILAINLFLDAQGKISTFMLPQLPLEIAIIKATKTFPSIQSTTYSLQSTTDNNPDAKNPNQKIPDSQFPVANKNIELQDQEKENSDKAKSQAQPDKTTPTIQTPITEHASPRGKQILTYDIQTNWNKLLEAIRPLNHSLQALLFSCQAVSVENNVITMATSYSFYKDKLNEPKNKSIVEDVFGKILGAKIIIKIQTNEEAGIKSRDPQPKNHNEKESPMKQDSLISDALNIFGGKVVKE